LPSARQDDLQILGQGQNKFTNAKKVDIKFPVELSKCDNDWEYNIDSARKSILNKNKANKDVQLTDLEVEMFNKIVNMDSSVKKDINE